MPTSRGFVRRHHQHIRSRRSGMGCVVQGSFGPTIIRPRFQRLEAQRDSPVHVLMPYHRRLPTSRGPEAPINSGSMGPRGATGGCPRKFALLCKYEARSRVPLVGVWQNRVCISCVGRAVARGLSVCPTAEGEIIRCDTLLQRALTPTDTRRGHPFAWIISGYTSSVHYRCPRQNKDSIISE